MTSESHNAPPEKRKKKKSSDNKFTFATAKTRFTHLEKSIFIREQAKLTTWVKGEIKARKTSEEASRRT